MKIKLEYVALAIIIIALSAYLILRQTDRTHYQLPVMENIPADSISKIEVKMPEETVLIRKQDGRWTLGLQNYPADSMKIDEMVKSLENLTITAMVSESKNYERYDLNPEMMMTIKAWKDEQLVRNLDVGKAASSYKHTFVKLPDDKRVYHVQDNLRNKFSRKTEALRDMKVLSFDKDSINEIELYPENNDPLQLAKTFTNPAAEVATAEASAPEAEVKWVSPEGSSAVTNKVNSILGILSKLHCQKYIEDAEKKDFEKPIYSVTLKGAEDYRLDIFPKRGEEDKAYPAISSTNDYLFELPEWQAKRIMISPEEILVKENQEEKAKQP